VSWSEFDANPQTPTKIRYHPNGKMPQPRALVVIAGLAVAMPMAACSLGTIGGVFSPESSDTPTATSAAGGTLPQPEMAGRWLLATDGGAGCAMNFSDATGGREGTVSPEGGCPGRFFTSRNWSYEQNAVIIRNHAGELLAQLNVRAADRLVGQGPNGEPVSLSR
jgi:hypothetical protein